MTVTVRQSDQTEVELPIDVAANLGDDLGQPLSMIVKITDEGVIFDCYVGPNHLATRGMTFDEWFEFVLLTDPSSSHYNHNA